MGQNPDQAVSGTDGLPMISVFIPVRNEAKHIGACLDSLLRQDYRGRFEIIVVDGLSDDGTHGIIKGYSEKHENVHLLSNKARVTPAAMNIGVRASRGDILCNIGGRWDVPPDFLGEVCRLFASHSVDCLGARIIRVTTTEVGRLIECARSSLLGGGLSMRNDENSKEQIVAEPNVAFIWKKHVFEKIGLFDESLLKNQDNEFNYRAHRAGFTTLYSPTISFRYHPPDTLLKLYRQMFGYAAFTPRMVLKHKRPLNLKFGIPAGGMMLWSLSLLLGAAGLIPNFSTFLLLSLYLATVLLSGAVQAVRCRLSRRFGYVCLALVVIHLGVCMGYLAGIVRLSGANRMHGRGSKSGLLRSQDG